MTSLFVAAQHIRQLQKSAEGHNKEITTMNDSMKMVLNELMTLSRTTEIAAAGVQFGADRQENIAKMSSVVNRMHTLQQVSIQLMTKASRSPQYY